MKAITTKYHSPTGARGSRYSASDGDNNRVTIPANYSLNSDQPHEKAAYALCAKLAWPGRLIGGGVKDGMVWVFADDDARWSACVKASNRLMDMVCAMYHSGDVKARLTAPTATWAEIIASELGVTLPSESEVS